MKNPLIAAMALMGTWPKRETIDYPVGQEAPVLPAREAQLFADTRADEQKRREALFSPFPYKRD